MRLTPPGSQNEPASHLDLLVPRLIHRSRRATGPLEPCWQQSVAAALPNNHTVLRNTPTIQPCARGGVWLAVRASVWLDTRGIVWLVVTV